MPNENKKLYLFEALELRAEYDARIKTLKETLPESQTKFDRLSFGREEGASRRPAPDFNINEIRDQFKKLEFKRRKLNAAIQEANFKTHIDINGTSMNLIEALEMRKGLNGQIGELHNQVMASAYQRVIYKEGRDILELNEFTFADRSSALEEARIAFRQINRKLRQATFSTIVDFEDE